MNRISMRRGRKKASADLAAADDSVQQSLQLADLRQGTQGVRLRSKKPNYRRNALSTYVLDDDKQSEATTVKLEELLLSFHMHKVKEPEGKGKEGKKQQTKGAKEGSDQGKGQGQQEKVTANAAPSAAASTTDTGPAQAAPASHVDVKETKMMGPESAAHGEAGRHSSDAGADEANEQSGTQKHRAPTTPRRPPPPCPSITASSSDSSGNGSSERGKAAAEGEQEAKDTSSSAASNAEVGSSDSHNGEARNSDNKEGSKLDAAASAAVTGPEGNASGGGNGGESTAYEIHKPTENGVPLSPSRGVGTIRFTVNDKEAPYVVLSVKDRPKDALRFIRATLRNKYGQHYQPPSLILSVTGGARNFTLPQRLERAVSVGLREAARRTNAWVVTGGTHTGVMKLTGAILDSLSKNQRNFSPPVIGIATYGIVQHGDALIAKEKESLPKLEVPYDISPQGGIKAALDPNHNIFLLVDDGTREKFGKEIDFRAALEKQTRESFDCPVITVVIQGGPGTLGTALAAIRQGTPIVVVDKSGLAADVLAYAYHFCHNPSSKYATHTLDGLRNLISEQFSTFSTEKQEQFFNDALECVVNPDLVHVFNLQDSAPEEFENKILAAIFSNSSNLQNKLKQAMFFDRPDVATKAINAEKKEKNFDFNVSLHEALVHDKPAFVELYLGQGAKISELKPKATFDDVSGSLNELSGLPPYALAIEELYKQEAKKPHSHVRRLVQYSNTTGVGKWKGLHHMHFGGLASTSSERSYNVVRMSRILSHLVHQNLNIVDIGRLKRYKKGGPPTKEQETCALQLIFLWAVCMDKHDMARMFWLRGDQSIINALIASRILSALSSHVALSGAHLAEERAKMLQDSKAFEALAVGVVDECYNDDTVLTQQMLHARHPLFRWNAVRLAYETNALRFLSHPATQSVVTSDWNGGLKLVNSLGIVILAYFMPFIILPFLNLSTEDEVDDDYEREKQGGTYFLKKEHQIEQYGGDYKQPSSCFVFLKTVKQFYQSPYVRFVSDLVSHLALCFFFSYYVLERIGDEPGVIEYILIAWFGSLLIEEGRQFFFCTRWAEYLKDTWNQLDVAAIVLYFVGVGVRFSDLSDERFRVITKTIHAFLVIVLWLRLMRYYALDHNLGPKLIMMAEMTKDVTTFIFLLFIFLAGYGVTAQVLLFPQTRFTEQKFVNVLFHPYFQIYGELFVDDISQDSGCVGLYPFSSCGREEVRILPFLLAVYVLITNILLVNLLIAMFNDTYAKVQEEAEALWRQQNYELYLEYVHRPLLPAPLILISHIRRTYFLWVHPLVRACFFCCHGALCACCPRFTSTVYAGEAAPKEMARDTSTSSLLSSQSLASSKHEGPRDAQPLSIPRFIVDFEEHNADRFVAKEDREKHNSIETCVRTTRDGIERMTQQMASVLEHVVAFRASQARQPHDPYAGAMSVDTSSASAVQSPLTRSRRTDSTAAIAGHSSDNYVPPLEYPRSDGVKRQALDPSMVPRTSDCPNYKPVEYTHPAVASQPVWADPADPRSIKFNTKDEVEGKVVDRTTCHPLGIIRIDGETGRPINPFGRTGMTGRGRLGKWGVNQAADTVVTRWKRSADGSILERNGKRVLEFVAIQRKDNDMWAIPGGFVDNGEDRATTSGREFIEETLGIKEGKELSKEEESALQALFSDGRIVDRIYSEDPRNTDNAWVETTCVNFHDDSGHHASKLRLQGGDDAKHARWLMVHTGLKLFASHKKLLRLVADSLHAYF